MKEPEAENSERNSFRVVVDPGICGFCCSIHARREGKWVVRIIMDSDCKQIQRLAALLKRGITIKELFAPFSKNPVYNWAEKVGCHTSCPVPAGILKACEVGLEVALPKDVIIRIGRNEE